VKIKRSLIILILLTGLILSGCQEGIKSISTRSRKATQTAESQEADQQEDQERQLVDCPPTEPHPVAESIAEKYQQDYQEIVDWYCAGYSFEDILVALQTSRLTDLEPLDLLEKTQGQEWLEIWEDLNLNP
jgi:hypothetical protein